MKEKGDRHGCHVPKEVDEPSGEEDDVVRGFFLPLLTQHN